MSLVVMFSVVVAFLLIIGLYVQTLIALRRMQQVQASIEGEMRVLRNEVVAVSRGAIGLGKKLQQAQSRLQSAERRQDDMEFKDVGNIAITHANKLVQMGAAKDELMSTCGLSQGEATLVSLMHSKSKMGQNSPSGDKKSNSEKPSSIKSASGIKRSAA